MIKGRRWNRVAILACRLLAGSAPLVLLAATIVPWSNGLHSELHAQSAFTFVHYFPDGGGAGSPISSLLADSDSTLYGFGCRQNGPTTLFGVTPDNQSFWYGDIPGTDSGQCNASGGSGNALIKGSDDLFYGTAPVGGAIHRGSIFSVGPDLQTSYTILYEFTEGPDGCVPQAGLVQADDGNFYGTTSTGCGNGGSSGTVFQLTPDGTFTTIHTFSAAEGQNPFGPLIQASNGLLYGTTTTGGLLNGGTVFRMTLDGIETTLHAFPYDTAMGLPDSWKQAMVISMGVLQAVIPESSGCRSTEASSRRSTALSRRRRISASLKGWTTIFTAWWPGTRTRTWGPSSA
jgi:uncharacterized repeat protein (TIGR03803 family)